MKEETRPGAAVPEARGRRSGGERRWSDGRLSERMEAIASLVEGGSCVVDVGCDHAYLPIALVERGICTDALACDVRKGPCERAEEHVRLAGLSDRIRVRLCDGIPDDPPRGTLIIAGMGGPLMLRILRDGERYLDRFHELILEPQSETAALRRGLEALSFAISGERMVLEDGKYYAVIRAVPEVRSGPDGGPRRTLTPCEARFGPRLLEDRDPVLKTYLIKLQQTTEALLDTLLASGGENAARRAEEVRGERNLIREAMSCYESEGCDPAARDGLPAVVCDGVGQERPAGRG